MAIVELVHLRCKSEECNLAVTQIETPKEFNIPSVVFEHLENENTIASSPQWFDYEQ